jgi:ATP-dependent Lon protease
MDNKTKIEKKKNKFDKYILLFNKKITSLTNQLDFLFKNKYIVQECYIEKMYLLNEIYIKVNNFENINDKKKNFKNIINDTIIEINRSLEKICNKIGSDSIKNIIDIYLQYDIFIENKNIQYINLLNQYNEYFIPLSSNKITDVEKFIKNNNIENINIPIVTKLIDYSKSNTLLEKISGASIVFYIDKTKIIYINGYFKKDSLNICKSIDEFKNKLSLIEEEIENLDIPLDFKEKYLDQLSLKDFIILKPNEISELFKNDYNEFISYKNKSLSQLIKEFVKSNIEKQRKIILLLLISDEESQFTAHIIFDLITDKSFLSESYYLSDLIFNSLHWKIQKIFKISNENFEKKKKNLENISVNDIPYESRILSIKVSDNIKSKAIEKLKEINGSKENSIKAQQWLDGFLKIPFNILKKEPIINFFKNYQNKIDKYIDMFTIKISEFIFNNLNDTNQIIYNIIIQIIDEFHSNIYKSENSYDNFIKYIKNIKLNICEYINYYNEDKITNIINKYIIKNKTNIDDNHVHIQTLDSEYIEKSYNSNINFLKNKDILFNEDIEDKNKLLLLNKFDNNDIIINKFINNNIIPSEDVVNNCASQLNYFKKIKKEMYDNNIINKNNIEIMVKKLNELECMLNLNLIKNEEEKVEESQYEDNYNNGFKKYILKNLEEFDEFINEWDNFKINKKMYMKEVDKILDKCTYGQTEAKDQMKRIIGQWMNGVSKGQCFGLCGPPGVGKTTLCKNGLAKCLFDENGEERPFAFLPLGGATNGSILEGHHYTYLGSTWGKIVDILMEKKCMNPIIYIDELDKISKTEHGKEIISILTHITDQSQNKEFYDRYFASMPIDLSNILFIFSYNDRDNIDRILRDRIQEITIKPLSLKEKIIISQNYIIPEISNNIGFSISEIIFSNEILIKIINEYTHEAGIRKLNEILYDIVRDINLKKIVNDENIEYPIIINERYTENILCNIPKMNIKKIDNISRIGMVNGLYATTSGLGGLTIIQVMKTISDKKLGLEKLTGNQGDVMKESMNCALTLAWNIIPDSIKKLINDCKEGYGLHIHCPESATPKDGPSAGLAITTAIVSRLTNTPIRNDIAMTGEVDLLGKAHEIGGLYSKLQGALNAGVKKVLIPKDNEKDLDIIFKKEEDQKFDLKKSNSIKKIDSYLLLENSCYKIDQNKRIFRNKLDIYLVNDIFEILEHALIDNNLEFNKIF